MYGNVETKVPVTHRKDVAGSKGRAPGRRSGGKKPWS